MNLLRQAELFPLGEQALIVRLGRGERTDGGTDARPESGDRILAVRALTALADKIRNEAPPGLVELVPAGPALAVHFDPLETGYDKWRARIEEWLGQLAVPDEPAGRLIEIPVCYGGEFGPDLADAARRAGLGEEEAVRLHCGAEYVVGMIGFAPGFPYLYGLPRQLAIPRRKEPRTKVPAGSVAIGGGYAGIYPADLPGGWHVIGRTPVALFDPLASPPGLLAPGDRVRFVPVDEGEYRRLAEKRSRRFATPSGGLYTGWSDGGPGDAGGGAAPGEAADPAAGGGAGRSDGSGTQTAGGEGCRGGRVAGGFRVLRPGLYTTLQDAGRPGFQRYGVTPGGAMDRISWRLANRLVGNRDGEPALEMTLVGPELEVLEDAVIAHCGADMEAAVNGKPLPAGCPVRVKAGDVVRFGAARAGCRAYLAVAGGFAAPAVLGGRGACPAAGLPGLLGRALAPGDVLNVVRPGGGPFGAPRSAPAGTGPRAALPEAGAEAPGGRLFPWRASSPVPLPAAGQPAVVRVVPGPEFDRLLPEAVARLLERVHTVGNRSDRMGLRLDGEEPVPFDGAGGMMSEPVAWGTVQLPPGGRPIVLAADRQTTGGYPRVLQVIAADWPLVGQLPPGARLVFRMVDFASAAAALRERKRQMRLLEWAIDRQIGGAGGRGG